MIGRVYCGWALVEALHRTAIPLHSITASDLGRYVSTLINRSTEMNSLKASATVYQTNNSDNSAKDYQSFALFPKTATNLDNRGCERYSRPL